jgi:O-antigen/teichoic acid export membrane protein
MKMVRLFAGSALVQVLGMALTLALGVQLARYLGPASYGIYGLIMGALSLLLVFAQCAMPLLAIRNVPAALQPGGSDLGSVWRWHMVRPLLAACVIFPVAAMLSVLVASYRDIATDVLVVAACVGIALTLLPVAASLLRGLGKNLLGQTIELVVKPGLMATLLALLYLRGDRLTVELALGIQLLVTCLCLFWAIAAYFQARPRSLSDAPPYRPKSWIATSAALSGHILFAAINGNYPILVGSLFLSPDQLGVLRVALASFGIVALPSAIAHIAVGPLVSQRLAAPGGTQLHDLLSVATLFGFVATVVGMVILVFAGEPLIAWVFGNDYRDAHLPLLLLGASQLIVTAFGVTGYFLALSSKERLVLKAFAISVPAGIVTSLILTPSLGIIGAASGTVVMPAVWHAYVYGFHKHEIGDAPLSLLSAVRHLSGRMK